MATAKTRFVKTNFQSGVISEKAYWRSDGDAFPSGCRELENFRVGDFGEIERRAGTAMSFGLCHYGTPEKETDPYYTSYSNRFAYTFHEPCLGEIYGFTLLDTSTSDTSKKKNLIMFIGCVVHCDTDRIGTDSRKSGIYWTERRPYIVEADKMHNATESDLLDITLNITGVGEDYVPLVASDEPAVTTGIGSEALRHASYAGEEYFVGADTKPFKVYLKKGQIYVEDVDFAIEPMNDTEELSTTTWTVRMIDGDDENVWVKSANSSGNWTYQSFLPTGQSLMLVNYLDSATVSVRAKYNGSNSGKKAGYTSDCYPVMGSVTLKTESGYWNGAVSLYERQREYGKEGYKDVCLGTITAGGMLGSASLPVTISRMNSEVYFKIDRLETVSGLPSGYSDTGTTVSLVMNGTQEVFLKSQRSMGWFDDDEGTGYYTKYKMVSRIKEAFSTNTYALSAFFSKVYSPLDSAKDQEQTNYPKTICFFQDRMILGGNRTHPKTIWMSRTGDVQSFQLGTSDDYAITTVVSGSDEEEIRWITPRDALLIGTSAREYALRGSTTAAITPTSIKVSKPSGDSAYGSLDAESYNSDEGLYCLEAGGKKLLRYQYSSDSYTYIPVEVNPLNPEIFGSSHARSFCVDMRPEQTFYVLRNDGKLAVCNFVGHGKGGGSWSIYSLGTPDGKEFRIVSACTIYDDDSGIGGLYLLVYDREGYGQKYDESGSNKVSVGMHCALARFGLGYGTGRQDGYKFPVRDSKGEATSYEMLSVPYTSRVKCTPWLISDGDAWGRRVSIQTTELCMNTGRAFRVSYDDGKTWVDENRVFRTSDGKQREIKNEIVECTSPSDWRDEATMIIETDDDHAFTLNAIRARLSIGEP